MIGIKRERERERDPIRQDSRPALIPSQNGEWWMVVVHPSLYFTPFLQEYLFRPLFSFLFAPSSFPSFLLTFAFPSSFLHSSSSSHSTRLDSFISCAVSHPSTLAFYSTFFCCSTQPTTVLDLDFADTALFAYTQSSRALTPFFSFLFVFSSHTHIHSHTLTLTLNNPNPHTPYTLPPSHPSDLALLGLHSLFYSHSTLASTALPPLPTLPPYHPILTTISILHRNISFDLSLPSLSSAHYSPTIPTIVPPDPPT